MAPSRDIRFGGWTLNAQTGELTKGDTRVRLQSQPLQILEALLARPGELVTREQLIAQLWPRGIVDFDTALNSAVHRLRTVLGDHAESPRYIETIPRRGYRFVGRLDAPTVAPPYVFEAAPVETAVLAGARTPAFRRRVLWGAALLAVVLTGSVFLIAGGRLPVRGTSIGAASAEAQARYLQAEHFFQRRAPGDIELSQKYYREAIELNPGFARAWAGLASTHWLDTVEGRVPPEQGLPRVREAAEHALALDPRLAEAHLRLANYQSLIGDFRERDAHMRKAREIEPDHPLVLSFSAMDAAQAGEFDTAVELQRRAVATNPLSSLRRFNLAFILYQAGRMGEAKTELLELRELGPTPGEPAHLLALVLILEGRFGEALALRDEWPDGPRRDFCLALAYHGLGQDTEAHDALRALRGSAQGDDRFLVAEAHAYRGEMDAAFESLQAATARGGVAHLMQGWTIYSPFLRALHEDARWSAWVATGR